MSRKRIAMTGAAVLTTAACMMGASSAMAAPTRVSSADLAKNQPITVNATTDISHQTMKAIPLAYYSSAMVDGNKITGFDLSDAGMAGAINNALRQANIDTSTTKNEATGAYNASNPMVWVTGNLLDSESSPWAGKLRDFLDKLKHESAITNATGTPLATVAGNNQKMSANVKPGVYLVLDKTATGRAAIAGLNGTGINGITSMQADSTKPAYTLGEVEYKIHDVSVSKKIVGVDNHGDKADDSHASAPIGGIVHMQLDSTVPNWTGYDQYYYSLNDTYSQGLSLNADSVQVKIDNKVLAKNAWQLDNNVNGRTFKIVFGNNTHDIVALKDSFPIGAPVTVTYDMTVTGHAVAGTADTNTVAVEHSHNPNDWTKHETKPGNTVIVRTGKIAINKLDMDNQPLSGAEFTLHDTANSPARNVIQTASGRYRLAQTGETGATQTLKVDTNGTLEIQGLSNKADKSDSYVLKETKSPYNVPALMMPQVQFHVKVDPTSGNLTVSKMGLDANNMVNVNNNTLRINNARNLFEMPKTGAAWMSILMLGGGALFTAGMLLILRKRATN